MGEKSDLRLSSPISCEYFECLVHLVAGFSGGSEAGYLGLVQEAWYLVSGYLGLVQEAGYLGLVQEAWYLVSGFPVLFSKDFYEDRGEYPWEEYPCEAAGIT